MNARYFTNETIHRRAQEIQELIRQDVGDRRREFRPSQSALLVIDMQRYFLEEESHAFLPAAPAIVPGIQRLIGRFSDTGRPVVFTRHLNTKEDVGMLGSWWRDTIREEDPLSEIIPGLDLSKGLVVRKCQYDAFYGTELEELLWKEGVTQLVITGVMTHLCCETTARSGFVLGFEPFFTIDGTATASQAFHVSTLLNLAHGFASPVLVEDIIQAFREENELQQRP